MNEEAKADSARARLLDSGLTVGPAWTDGSITWVDLVNVSSGETVWPRYGSGTSASAAIHRALLRYFEEQ